MVHSKSQYAYDTLAHKICRDWKSKSGLKHFQIQELISSNYEGTVDLGLLSKYLGGSRETARLMPESWAFALYLGTRRRNRGERDQEQATPIFPFFEYVAIREFSVRLLKMDDSSCSENDEDFFRLLEDLESIAYENFQKYPRSLEELRDKSIDKYQLPPTRFVLNDKRRQIIKLLFESWLLKDAGDQSRNTAGLSHEDLRHLAIDRMRDT
jgi:hypothetical protein